MWPRVAFETHPWKRDPEELAFVPKSRRRRILSTYESAVPGVIAAQSVELPSALTRRLAEAEALLARFDQAQASRGYSLPALILRSESSSSSQIERLTSSVRNVALAELSDKAPSNARLIAGNVAAMRAALSQKGPLAIESICGVHDALMEGTGEGRGLRNEQVWIGGTPYSPHGALFVPPHHSLVPDCLDDLVRFSERDDMSPIAKAAISHAQFETIHPFTDGNGRCGRALLHRMLAHDEVLMHAALPISAGLLHDVGSYMRALDAYHEGSISQIVTCLVGALELAAVVGARVASEVDKVLDSWRAINTDRADSASHRLAALLVEQPVVDARYLAQRLDVSDRTARTVIEVACGRGILTKMGNARRGAFYQATELVDILEEASSVQGIRRIAAHS